jgi:hypothetical protein
LVRDEALNSNFMLGRKIPLPFESMRCTVFDFCDTSGLHDLTLRTLLGLI